MNTIVLDPHDTRIYFAIVDGKLQVRRIRLMGNLFPPRTIATVPDVPGKIAAMRKAFAACASRDRGRYSGRGKNSYVAWFRIINPVVDFLDKLNPAWRSPDCLRVDLAAWPSR